MLSKNPQCESLREPGNFTDNLQYNTLQSSVVMSYFSLLEKLLF